MEGQEFIPSYKKNKLATPEQPSTTTEMLQPTEKDNLHAKTSHKMI